MAGIHLEQRDPRRAGKLRRVHPGPLRVVDLGEDSPAQVVAIAVGIRKLLFDRVQPAGVLGFGAFR